MKTLVYVLLSAVAVTCFSLSAAAQEGAAGNSYTPFMFSFATPLQVPTSDFDVGGLRINIIYGECKNFDGLDISALVGRSTGHANGLQIAGIANVADGDGMGLQVACVNHVSGSYAGLQIGLANIAAMNSRAQAQVLQIGVYNGSEYIKGCQIGVINFAREMIGMQIGVVNVIQNKDVPFLPIINGYF